MILNPPLITFVVPCMGRLEHLRRTLPLLARQPQTEVVVVDYSDPDQCGNWVENPAQSWPNVRVARYPGQQHFNLSRARNVGAKMCRTKYIGFIDADMTLLDHSAAGGSTFMGLIKAGLDERYFIRFCEWRSGHSGFLICWYPAFIYAGGYPAKTDGLLYDGPDMEGYGFDDGYMKAALEKIGLQERSIEMSLGSHLDHSQVSRVAHYSEANKDIGVTHPRNADQANAYLAHWKPYPLFGCNNQG